MINVDDKIAGFELIYAVLSYGMGSKFMHKAKKYGVSGGTILPGKGTVQNPFLNFLSLNDERKEIVVMATDIHTAKDALEKLNHDFHFEKPNKGIVFTMPLMEVIGSSHQKRVEVKAEERESESMYQLITTIVDRGKAEEVIDAAKQAGSKGGTIINARGSGVHETIKLFNMEIEPEKEMVLIISKTDVTEKIVTSIREKLEIDKPGRGVIFIQNVNKAYGIYGE